MNADGSYTYVAIKTNQINWLLAQREQIYLPIQLVMVQKRQLLNDFTVTGINDNDPVAVDDTDTVKRDASITRDAGSAFDVD